ncbi:hypothetical protein ERO13_A08G077050v2 [Gossypium hirsutum]|nr:hypothetical protein ERO13_A08G077050v2 [Gossypium hirsutum]
MEEALGFLLSPTSTMGRDPPTSRPQEAPSSWSVNGRENLPFWCKEATIGRRACRGHTWEGVRRKGELGLDFG